MIFCLCLALAGAPACTPASDQRTFPLHGQVLSLEPAKKVVTLKHDEVKGFMPAMTMPYEVRDERLLGNLAPGDLINATLFVLPNGAYLSTITKVGQAPIERPPTEAAAPAASSGFELLKVGDTVPDSVFVNQEGKTLRFSAFKGSTVVLTFIYTRCPLPTFCPLMDRHFVTVQNALKADPTLKGVHLVTVSFDPIPKSEFVLPARPASLEDVRKHISLH